ncbi:MAG: o-succinylbenzoate synthase [Firmicutes bacterium]|nr:o-succinylbenzoate synthase [Bacillota bacterium]
MRIDAVEMIFVAVPLKCPFVSAVESRPLKTAWLLAVSAEGMTGYAECGADRTALYAPETHASVYYAWKNELLPRLWQANDLTGPSDIEPIFAPVRGHSMAKAAIEMALWDLFARLANKPLWMMWPEAKEKRTICASAAVARVGDLNGALHDAEEFFTQGYHRIKIKIQPGWDLQPLAALRRQLPEAVLSADANGSYDGKPVETLRALDAWQLAALEQPYPAEDWMHLQAAAQLLTTPVCLDESVTSLDRIKLTGQLGISAIFNVKAARLGGYGPTRRVLQAIHAAGGHAWCGGLLETGIGRAHNLHAATLPAFDLPAELSASNRYFAEDLIDPPFVLEAGGRIAVPSGVGIGVEPNPLKLARFSLYRETLRPQKTTWWQGLPHGLGVGF